MRRLLSLVAILLFVSSFSYAVKPGLLHGKLVSASEASDGNQVVYRLRILVGRQLYDVEQRPIFFLNVYMPHEFFVNGPVLVRVRDRNLYLMRPSGKEMRMQIRAKRIVEDDEELASLTRAADAPTSSDTIAEMLNEAAERERVLSGGIPRRY